MNSRNYENDLQVPLVVKNIANRDRYSQMFMNTSNDLVCQVFLFPFPVIYFILHPKHLLLMLFR